MSTHIIPGGQPFYQKEAKPQIVLVKFVDTASDESWYSPIRFDVETFSSSLIPVINKRHEVEPATMWSYELKAMWYIFEGGVMREVETVIPAGDVVGWIDVFNLMEARGGKDYLECQYKRCRPGWTGLACIQDAHEDWSEHP